ncbi:homocysteine S-methyltransferase family protein [Psychrobacter sp.]|uniref:homocysteine S-methyltransferase family protein n=1 Tax=Psychrobacter sp. TaxID=56811 RepID=UPI0026488763|nr:homocysteine S-methyltransferase family protein [Psychrobacter sp.]MDN6276424.1 homocysteine S-methyltransferase family protein [Psychrobacter sp.]MDN6307577.1 homocysteine S-methyltransferase family protein [Psychrobacter sp.]
MMQTRTTPQVLPNQTHRSSTTPETVTATPMTILDGGMGRELEQRGAPFRQPEWSALSLSLAPNSVHDIHLDYIKSGATVITVNSYAVTPYHLGDAFFSKGEALIETAAKLAFEAVQASNSQTDKNLNSPTNVKIAGCLPPLFGSYRPDLFDAEQAPTIAQPLLSAQADYVDMWLVETQSSIVEAQTWYQLIEKFTATKKESTAKTDTLSKPIWIAFTLDDSQLEGSQPDISTDNVADVDQTIYSPVLPTLRSGESVAEAIQAMMVLDVDAVLFNCSQPEVMASALQVAKATIDEAGSPMQLGVYANAFVSKQSHKQANAQLRQIREDTTPKHYLTWAKLWQDSGASIIGGCCGIGTEHIEQIAQHLTQK